jgi:uncharacterized protein YbaP (TraB family)
MVQGFARMAAVTWLYVPVIAGFLGLVGPAFGSCAGRNLIEALAEADRQALFERAHAVPFAQGNLWRATREGEEITLIGTLHMDDSRHEATMVALAPALDAARVVLVEAGPEEIAALQSRLARDPALMVQTEGPTLPERLSPELWDKLAQAVRARGVPPFMAAKLQPWYLSMILSIPPCALEAMGEDRGLDAQVIEAAEARGLPVRALEPYDTVFSVFDTMSDADQLSMITSSLALEDRSEDMSSTLIDSYFDEEARVIWEFSRAVALTIEGYSAERVEREFALMEVALMVQRNQDWIPVLTRAAADGPVLAAFGALHLSGDQGVLALLQAEGFTLKRLPFR